jgi:hypothetical protein
MPRPLVYARAAAAAVVLAASSFASAAVTVINNFENAAPGTAGYGFRVPSFSSTTDDNLNGFGATITPNIQRATDTFPAGNPNAGTRVGEAQFQFIDTATNRYLRHTTSGATGFPNPALDLTQPVNFDFYSTVPVLVSLAIRETGGSGPIGSNGGSTGTIEFVGATAGGGGSATAGPVGKAVPANTWTTLTFDLPNEPVRGFTGNGVLDGSWGVLEALAITSTGDAGPITIYYDNFSQGVVPEPAALGLVGLSAIGLLARRRRA